MRSLRVRPRRPQNGAAVPGPDDEGSVLLLSLVYMLIALVLVTVVICASAIHLERKRLIAVADAAALAAADQTDRSAYFDGVKDPWAERIALTDEAVRSAARAHLRASPAAARLEGLRLVRAGTPDGQRAVVEVRAVARVPLLNWVLEPWSDGIVLTAESHAGSR